MLENNTNKVLLIDAGNTAIKLCVFEKDALQAVHRFSINSIDEIESFSKEIEFSKVVLSSVISEELNVKINHIFEEVINVDTTTFNGIKNKYLTPKTLGADRLCNAVYASKNAKTEFAVVLDIGTCIKFDLISKSDGYLGGSISPGINLRYGVLNEKTGKLPLLSNKTKVNLVGNNTESSIHSGVMNGMHLEIQGIISQYEQKYEDLTFFMTGGDAQYFEIHSKNDIFADGNLTVKGLYEIYRQHA